MEVRQPERAVAHAARLGFEFEGVFRQAVVYRSRDTAWFSIIDSEWPLRAAYERWLSPDNFDAEGGQRVGLGADRAGARRLRLIPVALALFWG